MTEPTRYERQTRKLVWLTLLVAAALSNSNTDRTPTEAPHRGR